jgi:hypothetical protein
MSPTLRTGPWLARDDAWNLIAAHGRRHLAEHFGSLAAAERVYRRHRDTILARCRVRPPVAWWAFDSGRPELADPLHRDPRVPEHREQMRAHDAERERVLESHPEGWRWRNTRPAIPAGRSTT